MHEARKRSVDADALAAVEAGIAEANRRERGDFDGLLGSLPSEAPQALDYVLSYLRDFLLDRYSDDEARKLLSEFEPRPGFRWMPVVPDDVELALSLLIGIRSAMRCRDDDPKHPDHFTKLIFGKAGVRDKKRQAGTRKERRPEVTQWIAKQLQHDPHAKSPALWGRAPQWITDQIGQDRFAKRVTACRKSVASK